MVRSTARPKRAATICPCSTRCTTPPAGSRCRIAIPTLPASPSPCSRRHSGATKPSGTATSPCTTRCWMKKAGSGSPLASASAKIRRSARKAPAIRPRRFSRSTHPAASSPCTIPRPRRSTLIGTCFSTHHLQFAEDANNTLWTSSGGGGGAVGWLNVKMWDQTHDEEKSQGWTPFILDTNGNGKRDAYTEPNQPADPTKDKRLNIGLYGVTVSPKDGSIWGTVLGFPGAVVRVVPGSDPTHTALAEYYEVPWNNPNAKVQGFSPRGLDIDRNGVVWTVLASGHLASFDRSKCKGPLNGPNSHRPALRRRLDALSIARTEVQRRRRVRQRRLTLLRLGRSVRHLRPGQETFPWPPATTPIRCSRWSTASG